MPTPVLLGDAACGGGLRRIETLPLPTSTDFTLNPGVPYDEERLRYWNAYLLFYERVPDPPAATPLPTKSRVTFMKQTQIIHSGYSSPEISPPSSPRKVNDTKLSQLTNLIK